MGQPLCLSEGRAAYMRPYIFLHQIGRLICRPSFHMSRPPRNAVWTGQNLSDRERGSGFY